EQAVEQQQSDRGDEATLLRQHREDEVRVLLGDEVELPLRALLVALAEQATRTDGDRGLDDLVAGPLSVGFGVEERQESVALVAGEARQQDRRSGDPYGQHDDDELPD